MSDRDINEMSGRDFSALRALLLGLFFWVVLGGIAFLLTSCKTTYTAPVGADAFSYNEEVSEYDVTVVVFGADWCPACRKLDERLNTLARTYAGYIKIVKVDVDYTNPRRLGYDFQYIPYVVVKSGGKDVWAGVLEDQSRLDRIVSDEVSK